VETEKDIPSQFLSSVTTFLSLIDINQVILAIGSGSGEILEKFKARGYRVVGLEQDPELCKQAKERGFEVIEGSFAHIGSLEIPKNIGGIWAGAAFAHTEASDLEHILEVIHLMLPDKGALFISVPKGQGEIREGKTVTQFYSEDEFSKLLSEKYFEVHLLESSTPELLTAVVSR
jgi:SAM-dependent methyltransferase